MFRNNDDNFDDEHGLLLGTDIHASGNNQRQEPKFGGFDEDDEHDYEEPDRDTDFATGYHADDVEEEEEEEEEEESDDAPDEDEPDDLFTEANTRERAEPLRFTAEEPDDWLERDGYVEDEEEEDQRWPFGLIAVAIVALVLLVAGGYGVMQQRAATEGELAELRATLATSASPEEVRTSLGALRELKESYDKLTAEAEALKLENRRLTDTVAGLESQLGVQQSVINKSTPETASAQQSSAQVTAAEPVSRPAASASAASAKPAAAPVAATTAAAQSPKPQPATPAPAAKPAGAQTAAATAQSAAGAASGPWFVNFGSYASRAVAEDWAARLRPNAGKVIIAPIPKDGKTLYRLRVVGLGSKSAADTVAHKLQSELQVSQLWVGRE